jgi:transglutaminase-like putative cysteine protease
VSFGRSFFVLTFGTTLWAFVMLAASGGIPPLVSLGWAAACVPALLRRRMGWPEAVGLWRAASVAVFLACLYFFFRGQERFYPVVYLFLFLTLNLLWTAKLNRHFLQLYALGFFLVLAASVSTTSILYAPMALLYLLAMVVTLVAFTLRRDSQDAFAAGVESAPLTGDPVPVRLRGGDERRLERLAGSPFLSMRRARWVSQISIGIIAVAVAVFLVVPRLEAGSLLRGLGPAGTPRRVSGFGETVQLGAAGGIESDPAIVIRVQIADRDPSRPDYLRLRGNTLDDWDGRRWTRSARSEADTRQLSDATTFSLPVAAGSGPLRERRLTFLLEPGVSEFLFLPERTAQVELDRRTSIVIDNFSRLAWMQRVPAQLFQYGVRYMVPIDGAGEQGTAPRRPSADPPRSFAEATRRAVGALFDGTPVTISTGNGSRSVPTLGEEHLRALTRLPADVSTPAVTRMAEEWAGAITEPLQLAELFERRFQNEFRYTTDVSGFSLEPDHLTRFLRTEQRGHCEYFATAMTLMLRARGVPARVVTGYLTDEWSGSNGGYFIVRQQNAHSWVEAWIEGAGWRTYDPTPPDGVMSGRNPDSFWRALSRWSDGLRVWWYQWVVDFDSADQRHVMDSVFGRGSLHRGLSALERAEALFDRATRGSTRKFGGLLLTVAGIVGLAAALLLARAIFRAFRPETIMPGRERPDLEAYHRLRRELERRSPRAPAQTAVEYAAAVAASRPDLADFVRLTEAYYAARFHTAAWGAEEARRARQLARQLRERAAA